MIFKGLGCAVCAACFTFCSPVQAITVFTTQFADAKDYSNSNPPTGGSFRDIKDGAAINRGTDLKAGKFTSLNLTTRSGPAPAWGMTLFDVNPADQSTTLFVGDLVQSVDFLTTGSTGSQAPGLVALHNEGSGQSGLVLAVENNGSGDRLHLYLLSESGETVELASVDLKGGVEEGEWYRLEMALSITDDGFSLTGKVLRHIDPDDPNSGVVERLAAELKFSGDLGDLGLNTSGAGQVGIAYRSVNSSGGASVTNYRLSASSGFPPPPLSFGGGGSGDGADGGGGPVGGGPDGDGGKGPGGNPPGSGDPGGGDPPGGDPPGGGNPKGGDDPPGGGDPPGVAPPGGDDPPGKGPTDPPGTDPDDGGRIHTPEPGTSALLLGGLAIVATLIGRRARTRRNESVE